MEGVRDFRQYVPEARMTVPLDGGRILAAAEDEFELRALGLDTLEGALAFRDGEIVRDAGARRTWRIPRPGGCLYLKVYRSLPWTRRWRILGRSASPARLEWDNIGLLRRAGFDMPEPVAMGEASAVLRVPARSFLLLREVPGPPLDEFLARGWPVQPGRSPAQLRRAVIRDVAGMIRRFHACGFFHKDLYCNHLLVAADERWGRPFLIDLQRVQRRFPPRLRWLVKDIAALQHSAPATVSRADRLRFLLHYLGKSGLDPEARRWAGRVLRKAGVIAAHRPKYG